MSICLIGCANDIFTCFVQCVNVISVAVELGAAEASVKVEAVPTVGAVVVKKGNYSVNSMVVVVVVVQ